MAENKYNFLNKKELLSLLQEQLIAGDDDIIWAKEKVKQKLLQTPELLYALHNEELETELFNEDGTLNTEGEWDRYFGETSNIRPYVLFPEVQDSVHNYVCYKVDFNNISSVNSIEKYCRLTFGIFVSDKDTIDKNTGIPRHDLIATILRRTFNWSNILGNQCVLRASEEAVTSNDFLTRNIVFEAKIPNSITETRNGNVRVINKIGV